MTVYLDSAYVAKCYLNEPDSPRVRSLVARAHKAVSSALCLPEVSSAIHRWVREGSLSQGQAGALCARFLHDLEQGDWAIVPVSDIVLREVEVRYRSLAPQVFLRSGDAIHLVSARAEGFGEIWSNDRRLLAAARHFGLKGRSV